LDFSADTTWAGFYRARQRKGTARLQHDQGKRSEDKCGEDECSDGKLSEGKRSEGEGSDGQ
jgi:uncharacterized low-complexity protein